MAIVNRLSFIETGFGNNPDHELELCYDTDIKDELKLEFNIYEDGVNKKYKGIMNINSKRDAKLIIEFIKSSFDL